MEGKVDKEVKSNGKIDGETQVECDDKIMNEVETKKILVMRALIEKLDPSSKEVDDFELRRFLRARDLDVDKASKMLLKYLKWRKSFGTISVSEIPVHNIMFIQGLDKQGRPIGVVYGGRLNQNEGGLDDFKRLMVFALDKLCARTSPGREKFMVIWDLKGFVYSNSTFRAYLAALSILQDFYPERLGKALVLHVPYIFWTMWKLLYPFIDKNTNKKITFVENKRLTTSLLEDIEEGQLPEIYGGKMPLVPIHQA